MGLLNTLIIGDLRFSDKDHRDSEKEHLHNVFPSNGYSPSQINKALTITKAHENRLKDFLKEKKVGDHKTFLPYIQGVIDKIAKHLKNKNIYYVFSPPNNIKNILGSIKDVIDPSLKKGVYPIPRECKKTYIGET